MSAATHPDFPRMTTAVACGDMPPAVFALDWWPDAGGDLPGLLTWYAGVTWPKGDGAPPWRPEGPAKEVLAAWKEAAGQVKPRGAAAIRLLHIETERRSGTAPLWVVLGPGGVEPWPGGFPDEDHARRALARRVLKLFTRVRVPCPACGGTGEGGGTFFIGGRKAGEVACPQCRGSGTVAPADLIPPEPGDPYRAFPDVAAAVGDARGQSMRLGALPNTLLGLPVVLPDAGPAAPVTAAELRRRTMTRGVRR